MVRRTIKRVLLLGCVGGFFFLMHSGCYYDVEETLYPGGCNLDSVTYSGTIVPILQRECYGCHGILTQNGGINLQGYSHVQKYVQTGQLLGAIRHDPGYSPMPNNLQATLDNCTIQKFEKWVDEGAQDN